MYYTNHLIALYVHLKNSIAITGMVLDDSTSGKQIRRNFFAFDGFTLENRDLKIPRYLVKWKRRMTGEKDSAETIEEYQNKRKGCVKLLEIYHLLHPLDQVSKKIMHTVLFVHLRWGR